MITKTHIARILILIGIISLSYDSYAQPKGKPKHSVIMMDFKLPSPVRNKSFRGVMNGLANVDFVYQYNLPSELGFGAGFMYSYYQVNGNVFQYSMVGKMEGLNPFVKLAKRSELNENMYVEYSLRTGYNIIYSSSNQMHNKYIQKAINVQPGIGFYMKSSDLLSFGLVISYNIIGNQFTPANLGVPYFPGVSNDYNQGVSQIFAIGFGFSTYLPDRSDR